MPVEKPKLIAAILIFFLVTALIVTPVVLWAVTVPKSTVKTTCSSDEDCNYHGSCVNGACKCNSPWGGPFCTVLGNLKDAALVSSQGIACSQVPTPCKSTDDCSVCSQDVQYSCQNVAANQNSKGLSGTFCLPTQPASACLTGVPGSSTIPGFYTWQGWADVETQAWTCDCEFPNFYPLTEVGSSTGNTFACSLSPNVCQNGYWKYPCIRDPQNPLTCLDELPATTCTTVSDCPGCGTDKYPPYVYDPKVCPKSPSDCPGYTTDQITNLCGTACVNKTCQKTCKVNSDCGAYPCVNGVCVTNSAVLQGASPFLFGLCDCSSQTCSTDADCAGNCLNGTCVNQRVALGPDGVPTCVKDTCAPGGQFVSIDKPPYTYGYCECSSGYTASGNTCVYTDTEKPSKYCALGCGHGTCIGPGQCSCPAGWKGNGNCTKFSCDNGCGKGTCIGPNTCACDPGYNIDDKGSCTVVKCPSDCVHGTCVSTPSGPACQCNAGFTGPTCNVPVTVTCSMTLSNQGASATEGACVNSGKCAFEVPDSCTGYYFGNAATFNKDNCLGNCTQGYLTPGVASLPPLLCSDGSSTKECDTTTCANAPIELNTCMKNDLYAYSCTDLCTAYSTLQNFDYNTKCKNQAPPAKPAYCT